MKRKSWKRKKKSSQRVHRSQARKRGKRQTKLRHRSANARRFLVPKTPRQNAVIKKALATIGRMRRAGDSLGKAARLNRIKPETVIRYAGKALYRSGPGKPYKVTKTDRLSAKMLILTERGPLFSVVRSSIERARLHEYNKALRSWRAAEDGAGRALSALKGLTVAGYVLITDPDVLIRLEEADQLDFDNLYYSVGGGS